jgi:hypothetical protein
VKLLLEISQEKLWNYWLWTLNVKGELSELTLVIFGVIVRQGCTAVAYLFEVDGF